MTDDRWNEIDALFEAALDVPPEDREKFLQDRCADPGVRRRVLRLLAHAETTEVSFRPGGALDGPLGEAISTDIDSSKHEPRLVEGQQLGHYRLIRRIGEGGMGEVWEAEQLEPVRRHVAIKLIKWGMDTRQVVVRFESERQALARMSHPNIARVFDAGATPEGRPYFAMEHVSGEPITEYCDRRRLATRERLELFHKVCSGVQHAHHKGVIHRDIKPTNVLVTTTEDGKAVPKIIDFGVARATDQRLAEQTVFTELGQLIGTPGYMSPEQADPTRSDVDTRTDVYSLGVLMYELLVGVQPFDPRELRRAGLEALMRQIRETDPPRPSTRLDTLGDDSSVVADRRNTDPTKLRRGLRGDLDWIVMKALEKDRARRYDSPHELAADVRRHLSDQPVVAGPPTAGYRLGKLVRRHRGLVAASAVVLIALTAGAIVSTWQAVRATRAEQSALAEAETSRQVSEFLIRLFEVSEPGIAQGENLTAREILARGSQRVQRELEQQPLIRARIMGVIGDIYRQLEMYDEAEPLLESSLDLRRSELGQDHVEVARSLRAMGTLIAQRGDLPDAEPVLQSALAVFEKALGPNDPEVATTLVELGDVERRLSRLESAEARLRRALAIREQAFGPDHPEVAGTLNGLGVALVREGRIDEAERELRRALEIREGALGPWHPEVAVTLNDLASVVGRQGRDPEGVEMLERAIEINEKVFGPNHSTVARSRNNLAGAHGRQGHLQESREELLRAREIYAFVYGPDHSEVSKAEMNLGQTAMLMGDLAEAERRWARAVEIQQATLDPHHFMAGYGLNGLASVYHRQGRYEEAVETYRRAREVMEAAVGPEHHEYLRSVDGIAFAQLKLGQVDEAAANFRQSLATKERTLGPEHPLVPRTLNGLGRALAESGELQEALALHERALAIEEAARRPDHPVLALRLVPLAEVQLDLGRTDDAERSLRRAVEIAEGAHGPDHPDVADALHVLAGLVADQGDAAAARDYYERALAIRRDKLGPDHPESRETSADYASLGDG